MRASKRNGPPIVLIVAICALAVCLIAILVAVWQIHRADELSGLGSAITPESIATIRWEEPVGMVDGDTAYFDRAMAMKQITQWTTPRPIARNHWTIERELVPLVHADGTPYTDKEVVRWKRFQAGLERAFQRGIR